MGWAGVEMEAAFAMSVLLKPGQPSVLFSEASGICGFGWWSYFIGNLTLLAESRGVGFQYREWEQLKQ